MACDNVSGVAGSERLLWLQPWQGLLEACSAPLGNEAAFVPPGLCGSSEWGGWSPVWLFAAFMRDWRPGCAYLVWGHICANINLALGSCGFPAPLSVDRLSQQRTHFFFVLCSISLHTVSSISQQAISRGKWLGYVVRAARALPAWLPQFPMPQRAVKPGNRLY